MLHRVKVLLEMVRFSHTVFALPFALLAAILAWNTPLPDGSELAFEWRFLLGILMCMVFARNTAMAINRIADRQIDARNPRTADRHLPGGRLSVASAGWFAGTNAVAFLGSCTLFWPNPWPLALSGPVLLFLCGYSFTKRFTHWSHYWLGISLMLAPICTWIALRGTIWTAHPDDILPAATLGLAVMLWVGGFDVIYACQDVEFDQQEKLHSIPAWLGISGALRLAACSHALMLLLLFSLPGLFPQLGLGTIYFVGLSLVAALIVFEHVIVSPKNLNRVNIAFFNVNAIVSVGLLIVGALEVFW